MIYYEVGEKEDQVYDQDVTPLTPIPIEAPSKSQQFLNCLTSLVSLAVPP